MAKVGSALLATMLSGQGYRVKAFIENIAPVDWDFVKGCDLVCISALTNTVMRAYNIAEKVREMDIPVVMGGVQPTFMPDEALEHADFVIRGKGERALAGTAWTLSR